MGADLLVRSRVWTITGSAATSFGPAVSAASPSVCSAGTPARANGPSFWVALVRSLASEAMSVTRGVPWSANPRRSFIVRRTSRSVAGNFCELGAEVLAALGGRLAGDPGVREEAGERLAVLGERLQHRVAVGREGLELVALVGEDLEDAVRLAQGGVRAVDHGAEVVAAGGEAGAELVEDDPEAVAVGRPVDVVDQVQVDRLAVRLDAAAGAGPRPAGRRGPPRARAAAASRARAAGSGRSRRSARRSATAA